MSRSAVGSAKGGQATAAAAAGGGGGVMGFVRSTPSPLTVAGDATSSLLASASAEESDKSGVSVGASTSATPGAGAGSNTGAGSSSGGKKEKNHHFGVPYLFEVNRFVLQDLRVHAQVKLLCRSHTGPR